MSFFTATGLLFRMPLYTVPKPPSPTLLPPSDTGRSSKLPVIWTSSLYGTQEKPRARRRNLQLALVCSEVDPDQPGGHKYRCTCLSGLSCLPAVQHPLRGQTADKRRLGATQRSGGWGVVCVWWWRRGQRCLCWDGLYRGKGNTFPSVCTCMRMRWGEMRRGGALPLVIPGSRKQAALHNFWLFKMSTSSPTVQFVVPQSDRSSCVALFPCTTRPSNLLRHKQHLPHTGCDELWLCFVYLSPPT